MVAMYPLGGGVIPLAAAAGKESAAEPANPATKAVTDAAIVGFKNQAFVLLSFPR